MQMKRKIIAILSLTFLILSCLFCVVACDKDKKPNKDNDTPQHIHAYLDTIVVPTCTTSGYTLHKCACGDEYRDSEVQALGHNFSAATYLWSDDLSTCTALRVCKTDGSHIELEVGLASKQITQEKTCLLDELSTYSATFSNSAFKVQTKENVKSADKLEHDFSKEWTIDKESTCIEKGKKSHHCLRCKETTDVTDIDFTTHTYKNEACSVCGEPEEATGLSYKLSDDETYYIVTGLGTETRAKFKIPSSYNGKPVKEIGDHAFSFDNDEDIFIKIIKEIVLPDTIITIGESAFFGCRYLTSITIPNSVTSIGEDAFNNCFKLIEVVNNSNVTIEPGRLCDIPCKLPLSVKKDGKSEIVKKDDYKFYTCDGVNYLLEYNGNNKNLTLPKDYNGEKYELFIGAFMCSDIESITIPDSVTSIGFGAFGYCTKLNNISFGNSVTSIDESAFYYCGSLTSITIPDSVTSIGPFAFSGCLKLVEVINKSKLNLANENTNYGMVAYHALNVKTEGTSDIVNVDDYLFYTYDNVNYLLGYVGNDTELVLPDNYNGQNYEIYNYAFYFFKT